MAPHCGSKVAWRWVPGVIVAVLCVGCAAAAPVPAAQPQASERAMGSGQEVVTVIPVPTVMPPTSSTSPGTSSAGSGVTTPPAADVFSSPTTVAEAWMRQWCAFDWREPMNANLDRAARFETEAAARADRERGDDAESYRSARAQQVSSTCDTVSAVANPEAPQASGTVYLLVSARRTNLAAGVAFETETVRSTRRVVRQPGGRWLVGEQVEAG